MSKVEEFRKRVERVTHSGRELTTLAAILQKVQRITANPNSSSSELAKTIASDSVLTARILRLVNSAQFSLERHVSSVDEAVVFLGYHQLRTLCSTLMTAGFIEKHARSNELDCVQVWKHSLGTAVAASAIQSRFDRGSKLDLFTAGLLCNIGRIVLDQWFREEMEAIIRMSSAQKIPMIDAEREILGVSHAEIGFWIAESWHFDEALAQTIRHHHGPAGPRSVDVVNLAYVITQAKGVGSPGDPILAPLLHGLFERMDIDIETLDGLLKRLDLTYKSLAPVFESVESSDEIPDKPGDANKTSSASSATLPPKSTTPQEKNNA